MNRLGALLAALVMLIAGLPLRAQGAPYLEAKRALVLVDAGSTIGTGFAISPTLVATACHVIKGAAAIQLSFWATKVRAPARRALCDERYDIAFVTTAVPDGTTMLRFAEAKPAQGDQVWVWGYPLGTTMAMEPSVAVGVVSATETAEGALALDVSSAPGNSGGPVLNADGQVVGIMLGAWNAAGQATGFKSAAAATTAVGLLASVGTTSQAPQLATATPEPAVAIIPGEGIGPVRLGMTPAQVQAALGLRPSAQHASGWMVWESRKIDVLFDNGKAILIDTEDPALATAEGIRIGSTDVDLIKAFGAPACSAVQSFRGKAYLGWYYRGLYVFLDGSPRRVFALRVLSNEFVHSLCH